MSVLGSIMSKVFGHSDTAAAAPTPGPASTAAPAPGSVGASAASPTAPTPAPAAKPAAMPEVDVEKVLSGMSTRSSEKLDWRHSIVDLMKLLGIDSSMVNRR